VTFEPLTVIPVHEVPIRPEPQRWLIESLWVDQGVGIIGGTPKSCKTWLALELAAAVASGTPVLGRFPVPQRSRVLVYAAEDSLPDVRSRLAALTECRGLSLQDLDLGLIDSPILRLDTPKDRGRLRATLDQQRPRLLILDPLVRLHRLVENSATDISALLGELRAIQRDYAVAILLVHHLRKNGSSPAQPGQALRGSGDLHAWGDCNLYLQRRTAHIILSVEHRTTSAPDPVPLELIKEPVPHLRIPSSCEEPPDPGLEPRILDALAQAGGPMDRESLRHALRTRNHSLGLALVRLRSQELIERCVGGFRLQDRSRIPVPHHAEDPERNGPEARTPPAAPSASPPREDRATVATDPSAPGDSRGMGGRDLFPAPSLLLTPFPREQKR